MKEKIIATVLVIMAVVMYTTAVINFMQGDMLNGVSDALIACSDVIIAWALKRQGFYAKVLRAVGKSHLDFMEALEKGVPAKLTIVKKDEGEEEGGEIPEEELTEDEKRIKRMAEEYDQLAGRFERLTNFLASDKFKILGDKSCTLLEQQHKAMGEYMEALKQLIQMECDKTTEKKD